MKKVVIALAALVLASCSAQNYPSKEGDDAAALIERINSRHGIHILEQAAKIGLGSREYQLVSIDQEVNP